MIKPASGLDVRNGMEPLGRDGLQAFVRIDGFSPSGNSLASIAALLREPGTRMIVQRGFKDPPDRYGRAL